MAKINPKQLFINKFKLVNAAKFEDYSEEEIMRINSVTTETLDTLKESEVGNAVSLYVEDEDNKVKGDEQTYTKLTLTGDHTKYFTTITPIKEDPVTALHDLPPGTYADNRDENSITSWLLGTDQDEIKAILRGDIKLDIDPSEIVVTPTDDTKGNVTVNNDYVNLSIPYYIADNFDGMVLEITGIS